LTSSQSRARKKQPLRVASLAHGNTLTYNQDAVAAGLQPVYVGGALNFFTYIRRMVLHHHAIAAA